MEINEFIKNATRCLGTSRLVIFKAGEPKGEILPDGNAACHLTMCDCQVDITGQPGNTKDFSVKVTDKNGKELLAKELPWEEVSDAVFDAVNPSWKDTLKDNVAKNHPEINW